MWPARALLLIAASSTAFVGSALDADFVGPEACGGGVSPLASGGGGAPVVVVVDASNVDEDIVLCARINGVLVSARVIPAQPYSPNVVTLAEFTTPATAVHLEVEDLTRGVQADATIELAASNNTIMTGLEAHPGFRIVHYDRPVRFA